MKTIIKNIALIIFCILLNNSGNAQDNNKNYIIQLTGELSKIGTNLGTFPLKNNCELTGSGILNKRSFINDTSLFPKDMILADDTITPRGNGIEESDKNVFWIHGLNGDHETWIIPAVASQYGIKGVFDARKITSVRPGSVGVQSYSEDFGITVAASDVSTEVQKLNLNLTNKDFVIAHSQGGIVAREWLRKIENSPLSYPNYVHGLVTYGTPHGGAQILNQTRIELMNRAQPFLYDACVAVSTATIGQKIMEAIGKNMIASMIISDQWVRNKIEEGCSFTEKNILPFVIDNMQKNTTKDYYVGSPFMTGTPNSPGLINTNINTSVVQFVGVEEEPVFWRYMASMQHLGNDKKSNTELAFGYTTDDQLIQSTNKTMDEISEGYYYYQQKFTQFNNMNCAGLQGMKLLICNETRTGQVAKWHDRMLDMYKGLEWFRNANDYYKLDIIGAGVPSGEELFCSTVKRKVCMQGGVQISSHIEEETVKVNNANECNNKVAPNYTVEYLNNVKCDCYTTVSKNTIRKATYTYKPSDGVVLAESAGYKLNVQNGNTHAIITLYNTNHSQMLNSDITKLSLNKLYDGDYGPSFISHKR